MTIQEVQLSASEWRNFWTYYKGEPQQLDAIERLRQYINEADPSLLTREASWVEKFREKPAESAFTPDSHFSLHVTEHVTYGELCANQEARRFTHQHQCDTALKLCQLMEKARSHFGGKPIVVTSGHRPEPINTQVGGAPNSEHTYSVPNKGAVDFLLDGISVYKLQEWCDENWDYSVGFGAARGFVHVGMRQDLLRRRWDY